MLIKHKILLRLGELENQVQIGGLFESLIKVYLKLFSEVQTLVFDLGPFLKGYIKDNSTKRELLVYFEKLV